MNFKDETSTQLQEIKCKQKPSCKVVDVDIQCRVEAGEFIEFEGIESDLYIEEKRRGGANSHQKYKPLKAKVEELCRVELNKNSRQSALQLCAKVAKTIENKHSALLKDFVPYSQYVN